MRHWSRFYTALAIFLVALCAVSMPATGQNDLKQISNDQAERQRIQAERSAIAQVLAQEIQACYQKFSVAACLNEARDAHNEKERDLKRQEVALVDAQRRLAAADRLRTLDERNSAQAQLDQAQRRGRALEATARRHERRSAQQSKRAIQQAPSSQAQPHQRTQSTSPEHSTALHSHALETEHPLNTIITPSQKIQQERAARLSRDAHGKPVQTAQSKDTQALSSASQGRALAAQQRRSKALEREANRKKPAAASLPVPP